ncbi:MAG: hypothetical protein PUD12_02725 [Firmicutes bacterium]|nr:hypothetical protein [Bacillota bacterium]
MNTMSILIRKILVSLLLCMALLICAIPVNAATYTANSSGQSFSEAWSVTKINTSVRTFKYGYNTTWINEDYTHTYHRTKDCYAYVKNSGAAYQKNAVAGKYAKAEITHHTGTVYYEYGY